MITVRRALAVLAAAAAIAAAVPLGCRSVLGIEDRGDDALTCDTYCDTIAAACTGTSLQYESRDACLGLCKTFPVGTLDDTSGDTLGCRLHVATAIGQTGEGDCAAAGPGGNDQCGSNCDAYCNSILTVCPSDFAAAAACRLVCKDVPECSAYYVAPNVVPNVDSIQCRLYHLTAATLDPLTHCPHAIGKGMCTPVAKGGTSCSTTDGGADGG